MAPQAPHSQVGQLWLIGSGETSASAHKMYERMFTALRAPVQLAILETPAGFEVNSALVAQRVSNFIQTSMKNFSPSISVIPARRRDGPFSTNDPKLSAPILGANCLYLGAGSPTYLVRHLNDTLALRYLLGRHRAGASMCLASAAAIAFGAKTLPVYEIFKAGDDLHWVDGLDLFGLFGLELAVVTHWDNREGGAQLDTRRCYMGMARMEQLTRLLPPTTIVLGIDEHTGILFDFQAEQCQVIGKGRATILAQGREEQVYQTGASFPIQTLGPYRLPTDFEAYGPHILGGMEGQEIEVEPTQGVLDLIQEREEARHAENWAEADSIRLQVAARGFEIQDTSEGPHWRYKGVGNV